MSTPMMKQYYSIKREHPDALLMFRMGDFYETFGEDARTVSRELFWRLRVPLTSISLPSSSIV